MEIVSFREAKERAAVITASCPTQLVAYAILFVETGWLQGSSNAMTETPRMTTDAPLRAIRRMAMRV
jgi:hypothetical protein